MARTSGTLRKVTLDGVPYLVPGDINVTLNLSPFETEGQPSSGETMYKMTIRIPTAEGVTLSANPVEQDQLRALSERLSSFPLSLTLADNSVYISKGRINFENVETESNVASIVIIPDRALGAWELFASPE